MSCSRVCGNLSNRFIPQQPIQNKVYKTALFVLGAGILVAAMSVIVIKYPAAAGAVIASGSVSAGIALVGIVIMSYLQWKKTQSSNSGSTNPFGEDSGD